MAALTTSTPRKFIPSQTRGLAVEWDGTTGGDIYKGALLAYDANGSIRNASGVASEKLHGLIAEKTELSDGVTRKISVYKGRFLDIPLAGVAAANTGDNVWVADSGALTLTDPDAVNGTKPFGWIVAVDAVNGLVEIDTN